MEPTRNMRRAARTVLLPGLAVFAACTQYIHLNDATTSSGDASSTSGGTGSTGPASPTTSEASTVSSTTAAEPTGDWDMRVEAAAPLNWWRFDELEGTAAIDHGSGKNDGTYANGITLDQEAPRGRRGAHFDGGTLAGVVIGASPLATPWTLEAVFFRDETSHPGSSALLSEAGYTAIKVEQFSGTNRLGYTFYNQFDQTFWFAPTPTAYTHVVFVCEAETICVYFDGESVECRSITLPLSRGSIGIAAGLGSWGDAFGGVIDELVIYDRALTDDEVAAHAAVAI